MKKDCNNCFHSGRPSYEYPCSACTSSYPTDNPPTKWELKSAPKTNGDWIRSMTDRELAQFFGHTRLCDRMENVWCKGHDGLCENCLEEWLQQPVEDE